MERHAPGRLVARFVEARESAARVDGGEDGERIPIAAGLPAECACRQSVAELASITDFEPRRTRSHGPRKRQSDELAGGGRRAGHLALLSLAQDCRFDAQVLAIQPE